MSTYHSPIEKTIAVILIIWGGLCLYELTEILVRMYTYGVHREIVRPGLWTIIKLLFRYGLMLVLSLSSIISGIFLLLNKKAGWMIGMIVLLTEALFPVLFLLFRKGKLAAPFEINDILFGIIWFLIFASFLGLLLLKSFRLKYSPSFTTYLIIMGVAGLLLFDFSYRR